MVKNMRVENIVSNNGNKIANQFIITGNGQLTFQSYESTIVVIDYETKEVFIGDDYDYSMTTGKYRNIFFRDYAPYDLNGLKDLATLRKAIKDGKYNGYIVTRKSL